MNNKDAQSRIPPNSLPSSPVQPTPALDEGPYYKAGSPERTNLYEAEIPGERLILTGYVFDAEGKPVSHAWLDFWQANGKGRYDNAGYILRGHQYTDKSGKYALKTVLPGGYDVRTPHIHVKVQADNSSPILTTQLFLPGLASNKPDFLYRDDLQVGLRDTPDGKEATFNFVLSKFSSRI
jgi:protocatechuate 3,4-dioxygenase beta subunit